MSSFPTGCCCWTHDCQVEPWSRLTNNRIITSNKTCVCARAHTHTHTQCGVQQTLTLKQKRVSAGLFFQNVLHSGYPVTQSHLLPTHKNESNSLGSLTKNSLCHLSKVSHTHMQAIISVDWYHSIYTAAVLCFLLFLFFHPFFHLLKPIQLSKCSRHQCVCLFLIPTFYIFTFFWA